MSQLCSLPRKILIANRGEIACRIAKTCRRLGIDTVAVYSDSDRDALHVRRADASYYLGADPASESYLQIAKLIAIAKRSACDAVHPGYGLLAENPDLAQACSDAGILFIGPKAETIALMGRKDLAKDLANKANVPTIPGFSSSQDDSRLTQAAKEIGTPLLVKAAAGGGGKGMLRVDRLEDFATALARVRREAISSFGSGDVLLEKYIHAAKHIEVQIFADSYGNTVHLFERECSLQRRHQKVIEEAPSPALRPAIRRLICEAACSLARHCGYENAGTVEFVYDAATEDFYFLEMNTRIQVEHPVTELITGIDLVEWQIKVAGGSPLPLGQDKITRSGHAIEARLYCEDTRNAFAPAPGSIKLFRAPPVEGVRLDSGIVEHGEISHHYDPMVAKLVVHAEERMACIRKIRRALLATQFWGPANNLGFLYDLLGSEQFAKNSFHTQSLDVGWNAKGLCDLKLGFAAYLLGLNTNSCEYSGFNNTPTALAWDEVLSDGKLASLRYRFLARQTVVVDGTEYRCLRASLGEKLILQRIEYEACQCEVGVGWEDRDDGSVEIFLHSPTLGSQILAVKPRFTRATSDKHPASYAAPMPGKVTSVLVEPGELVSKGQQLLTFEAMKMENTVKAHQAGTVAKVCVQVGEQISKGRPLIFVKGELSA